MSSAPAGTRPSHRGLLAWTLSFLRPYRWLVAAYALLSLVEVALGVLAPWPLKAVVDNAVGRQPLPPAVDAPLRAVAGDSQMGMVLAIVVAGLVLQVLNQLVSAVHTQVMVVTGQRMVLDLRTRLFDTLQALPLRHHVHTSTSDAVFRVEIDAYCIDNLVMKGIFPLVTAVLTLLVMFLVLLRLDVQIALLSLLVVPFHYASLRYYINNLADRAERVQQLESRVYSRLYETFSAIKLVKSFVREVFELARFTETARAGMEARIRLTWQESIFNVVVSGITIVGTAVVLSASAAAVINGRLTIGVLLVVVAYLQSVYGPLSAIAHTTGSLQSSIASARRVREMFALVPETRDHGGVDPGRPAGHIQFDNVGFAYGPDRRVLDRVTFEAHPGELVAIVGLTGAGKTSLVSMIPRFYDADTGRVALDGRDIRDYDLHRLREQIAIVPQESLLFSGTIADNIRYGRLEATDAEVEAAARAAHAHDFILRLAGGYAADVAESGGSLSGGERQRLSIARALLKDAPIIILDEPTSSLDALSEEKVFGALKTLRQGRTTLVIAHRLSTIRDADRILVLDEGTLVAQGRHDDLLAGNDLYRRMCARLSVGKSLDEPETVDEILRVTR
ncbi:MAG: ABC transporter ATP-binding protein [Acidobacteria bacterium]|nr:ABC transporter ATP-binding protein [Acidobacteriota bacterium]